MKKILFIINGYGLGNSTRCHAILSHIKNAEIHVATSKKGLSYFSRVAGIRERIELEPLSYGLKEGRINLASTLRELPTILGRFRRNAERLREQVSRVGYDLLITDSDYTALLLKSRIRCPLVAINNSDCVLAEALSSKWIPPKVLPQLALECLDFAYHLAVPDLVISPSIKPRRNFLHFRHVPPVVRRGIRRASKRGPTKRVAVMGSGSSLGKGMLAALPRIPGVEYRVIGLRGRDSGHVKYIGREENNIPYLNEADLLVINGGFSSVSEAVCLRKNTLVVPLPNHAEQHFNAKQIQEMGLGSVCEEKDFRREIVPALAREPKRTQAIRTGAGALAAVKLIIREMR